MTKIEGDYSPHMKTVKAQLLKIYGDDTLIAITVNKAPVFSYLRKPGTMKKRTTR